MKAELRLRSHSTLPDRNVVEVWYRGVMIATVTGADGPGIRVISKHIAGDTTSLPLPTGYNPRVPVEDSTPVGVHTVILEIPWLA